MSQSRDSFSSEGASAPGKSSNGNEDDNRSILVSNIPPTLGDDKVVIHFQKSSSGGGDVKEARRLSPSQARVIFEDVKVIDRVVARTHDLAGVTVQVEAWSSFLGRALEMDRARHRESSCVQYVTVQIHQPVTRPVWDSYMQKMLKTDVTFSRSTRNVTLKGTWNDVVEARNLLLCEVDAAKYPLNLNSKETGSRNGQNQAGGAVTNNMEHNEDASCTTPADDSQYHLQAAVNNGAENPDEDLQYHLKRVHLDGKQREETSSARPHRERNEKNHGASSSRSTTQITEIDESRLDNLKAFAHSQSSEPREEDGLKEAMEYGTQASFQRSRSAPDDGGSSAYGSSSTRPNKEEEQRSGASSRRSTSQMTKTSQKWDDDEVGFTRSQSREPREEVRQHEARGDERLSGFQRSMSALNGTSSTYGTSSRGAVGPQWDETYHSPSAWNGSKHSSGSKKQGVAASDLSMLIPGKNEANLSDPSMAHQHVGPPQDRTNTRGTYKLPDSSAEVGDDEAMTETIVDQTVDPDIMSFIINVHSSEINKIARKHRVNFDHSKDNSTVYIKGSKMNAKAASEDFITLFQSMYSKLQSRYLDLRLHDMKAEDCIKAVELAQESHPSVLISIKKTDGKIMFIGEEQEICAARATICRLLNISEPRRRRGSPSGNVSTPSTLKGQTSPQPKWYNLSMSGCDRFQEKTTGVQINIVKGDITTQNVDVIVNAANCSLTLVVGVSGAISRAGGRAIQSECDNYIIKYGSLRTTDCVWTTPGGLPCKYIIHAVGPNFVPGSESKCKQELYDSCQKALVMAASKLSAKSIAMPAISSGASGMPRRVCAEAMCNAIVDFVENGRGAGSSLLDIRLVDNDREAVKAFCDAFKAKIAKDSSRGATGYSASGTTYYTTNVSMTPKYPPSSPNFVSTSPINYPGPTSTYAAAARSSSYPHGMSTALTYPHPSPNSSNSGDLSRTYPGTSQTSQSLPSIQQAHSTTSQSMSQLSSPGVASSASSASGNSDKDDECPICLCDFSGPVTTTSCKHKFCADCLKSALKLSGQCPICKSVIGQLKGNQPHGTMTHRTDYLNSLPGCGGHSIIEIHYDFHSGIQGPEHPNPGKHYTGTSRTAYLPDNAEGREVLRLLRRAFDSHLVFTIGTSATTGLTDTVVWNDIHHKTSKYGGPNSYGYPDPQYLTRVKEELAAKGIK